MKSVKVVLLAGMALFTGWVLGYHTQRDSRAALQEQNEALRSSMAVAQQSQEEAIQERDSWRNRAETLEHSVQEVPRLRAEVSRLNSEQAAAQRLPKTADPSVTGNTTATQSAPTTGIRKGVIPLESAPPAVAATIADQVGNGRVKLALESTKDGKAIFGIKGELPDGRAIAMRLAEDGSVLEKSTEIPAEAVPVHIQDPMAKAFEGIPLSGAREIIDGDHLFYELISKTSDARMQITVRGDGAILGYSAKLNVPEAQR